MKKLIISCAALAVTTSAYALGPVCLDFDPYCDGLELSLNNGVITGFWRNTDCAGTDVVVRGKVFGNEGRLRGDVGGNTYAFVIQGLPLAQMDMYMWDGSNWNIWITNLAYNDYSGPCLFDEGSSISTVMVD